MPLSGPNGTFEAGEEITVVDDASALRYIEKGIATFDDEKEHDAFLQKVDDIKQKEAEKKAEAEAIMQQDKLRAELNSLAAQVVIKAAEVNGKHLRDEEIVDGVETLLTLFLEEHQNELESKEGFFSSLFFSKK